MADVRQLKDEATRALQTGKLDRALELYNQVVAATPKDLAALLRVGDILKQQKRNAEAIEAYTKVAEGYGADGQLLKAIAACKLVLELDANHTGTQKRLADLYAKKTGRAATATLPVTAPGEGGIPMASDADVSVVEEREVPTIPLFSDLPKNAFIQLLEQMQMRTLLPGEVVIREGDQGDAMFIISNGKVKVTKTGETGSEVVLARLTDGTFFGEMALLSELPRTASVIAEEETLLFVVSRATLDGVVKSFPSVKNILLRFYRQRLLATLMATSPIFKPLSADERKALIEKFKAREVAANEKIIEEGQAGEGLYMLLSGKLEVGKKGDGKSSKVIAHLKEGDVFGEMSLLSEQPVNATIRTLRKSIVLMLPKKTFNEAVAAHPQLLQHIKALSSERNKTTEAILKGQLRFSEEEGLVLM